MDGKKLLKLIGRRIRKESRRENNTLVTVLTVIGLIVLIAVVIYAVIKFMTPDEYEGYDDAEYDTDDLYSKDPKNEMNK